MKFQRVIIVSLILVGVIAIAGCISNREQKEEAALENSIGWAGGGEKKIEGILLHTTNGGETWTKQISNTTERFESIFFIDKKNGWAVGSGGLILHTKNAGKTWTRQDSGTDAHFYSAYFIKK